MKKAVSIITLVDILFILALSLFSSLGEPFSTLLRLGAVFLMAFLAYRVSLEQRSERERAAGVAERRVYLYRLGKDNIPLFLSSIMPTVAVVFLVSYLTSLLLGSLGLSSPTVEVRPLYEMLLVNCLLPTVIEEVVFRYIPMKLLAPYSSRWCIVLSSLFFALSHLNLFQIPYAFLAGVVFMTLNLMTESMIPSLILHLLNNVISVLWISYSASPTFAAVFVGVLVLSALASLIPLIRGLLSRKERVKALFTEGEPLVGLFAPLVFTVFTLVLSAYNLF